VVSGVSFWAGFAVLVVLTAAGLRYYLPLARRVLVEAGGRVDDDWVGPIDGAVAVVLAAWFLMLGYDALAQEGKRTVEFGDVITGAVIYASIVLFLLGLLVYRNLSPSAVFGFGGERFFAVLGSSLLALAAVWCLCRGRRARCAKLGRWQD
jgi:hypothetical protein